MLDDLSTHLAAGALAHPENVLDLLGFEGGDGVGADHAAIGDNAGLGDPEALAQALDHWQQLRHVGGIAGHQEGGDRPVGVIEHNAEHDLLQMPTVVFGMTVLAEAFTTGAFEPQCRGVEKRDRNGTEQRLAVAIERLFDRLRGAAARRIDLAEPGHRLIGVVEIEPLGARHAHPAAPVIGMAVGTRDHQPVQHREIDRALDIEGKAPVGDEALQRVAASRFRP